ncbi:MAG TPA: Uma2 family endonuclease [Amaricoccus sp.]|jgi:Uma2 family endonuclease|nr:Uma2 family endonuclease [Amaricoccus sp.]
MQQPGPRAFTADEFLAWALDQPEGRFELDEGLVVAMTPERVSHAVAKLNATIALRDAIGRAGLPCQALPDGVAVRVNDRTVYEPDALVRCGPASPGDAVEVSDPVIVVEVVSPSSRGIDSGVKLAGYFQLASLRHYLIVDHDKRVVIHHHRDPDGRIEVGVLHDGRLTLDPPGLAIEVRDLFLGL